MGNYSYLETQEGIDINFKKLKSEMKKRGLKKYLSSEQWEQLKSLGLGEFIDGWKIQGYWYNDFCKFLYCVLQAIKFRKGNTSIWDNCLEMKEEQGYHFSIHFYIEGKTKKIKVFYVPMEMLEFGINSRGEQI